MRAVGFDRHGDPSVLKVMELPDPKPEPGEVVIRVLATSLNRIDTIVRRGYPGIPVRLPHVPGADIVGYIESIGPNTDLGEFRIGDLVLVSNVWGCGSCRFCKVGMEDHCPSWTMPGFHVWGGYGELVRVPVRALIKAPKGFSINEMAVLPLAYGVSWKALRTANVGPGDWVLILSGSGGIGTALTILAKALSARVIAVTSRPNVLRSLGADVVVGYDKDELMKVISEKTEYGVDTAIDTIGDTLPMALDAIRPGGTVITFGILGKSPAVQIDIRRFYLRHAQLIGIHNAAKSYLREIIDFMVSKGVRSFISRVATVKETPALHELMESRGVVGKVVMIHEWD
ncbi:alcohol dehydrogenase [Vulcanisaeta moutnovskia 768-28]|uniref:Alcohol dehydrogenase n=1 Tax=Vulcanisaeta moutnovskia (strain 768-28) TaxID=985053 RepID=F0QWK2_VULM7|nr:alcohol dehydrogenase catalytic domain-containing protein [Vulcanisaeta moutnovskia]ADY01050.1 alcohol dehydrogenase [Vulcanisaeta moutnovskia 768-28]